ncbi:MAG: hypothetical protein H6603_01930 [Flavobacteriales bacterium]|nr:hypothetical protein [Flavobacteriales bacterium]MCB9203710.1 hypothetical protein [Flavobacteriales bacterium]
MKTLRILLALTSTLIVIAIAGKANAQMSEYKFKQQFDKAFEYTLNGETEQAQTILQKLHNEDKGHCQVAYLLALNNIKLQGAGKKSASYLEQVVDRISVYHQVGRVEDRTAPVKAWFFLAQSYANTNQYDKAINAYRNYMSCIQLASLDHKREIVEAIKELRAKKLTTGDFGIGHELANQKP